MQAGQMNYIPLTSPLACYQKDQNFGWVIGISSDTILAKSPSGLSDPLPFALSFHLTNSEKSEVIFANAETQLEDGSFVAKVAPESRANLDKLITQTRKNQHIEICRTSDVESSDRYTGFENIQLKPCALPDLNWNDVDTSTDFLGHKCALPFLITGMTGGVDKGTEINQRLASAAQACGIPMGVGSQRIALEHSECESIFKVRDWAPDVFLIANLGISQIGNKQAALDLARRAIDMIDANAIAIHLNILQELVQTEGDRNFAGLWDSIAYLQSHLTVPVIIKEVGSGIDLQTAEKLHKIGITCLDVGGRGGTSWSYIESKRSATSSQQILGEVFRDWGIPTAHAVAAIADRYTNTDLTLIATGGIRSGLTVAKAVGLGAKMCGIGLPLFKAALISTENVIAEIRQLETQLKVAMMASNSPNLSALSQKLTIGQPYADATRLRIQNLLPTKN